MIIFSIFNYNMMTEEEYKNEWLNGKHNTDYNNCRFSENKIEFCKNWLSSILPDISFDEPKNIVDIVARHKIKIATDSSYCKLCAKWTDKISVNTELHNMKLDEIIIPTIYFQYGKLTEEVFNYITNNVIIKCNHGSGWNIILNKPLFNIKYIIDKINNWLDLNYAYITGYEAQYEKITPGIIIQPVLVKQPTDYGFWCVNGEIEAISLTKKYGKNLEEYIAFVDKDGNKNKWIIGLIPEQNNLSSKQKNIINTIKPYVEKIAKLFDFVRVDMYYINDKVYFGETTFTPCSGRLIYKVLD